MKTTISIPNRIKTEKKKIENKMYKKGYINGNGIANNNHFYFNTRKC